MFLRMSFTFPIRRISCLPHSNVVGICRSDCLSAEKQAREVNFVTVTMSFLNARVSPELPSANSVGETELKTSFGMEREKEDYNCDNGKDTAFDDTRDTKECQEGIDCLPAQENHLFNSSGQLLNGKAIQTPKCLSYNPDETASPVWRSRSHSSDRVILLVLCLMCAASLVLTLLMLFGAVRTLPDCPCTAKPGSANANQTVDGYAALSKSVQDLRQRFTTDLEGSQKSMSEELAKMKNHSEKIGIELEDIKKKYLQLKAEMAANNVSAGSEYSNMTAAKNVSAGSEYSNKTAANNVSAGSEYSNKDNISLLWSTITAYRQEVLQEVEQLDQKIVNISRIQGLRGPPGYNGTQGPPGDSGPRGPRGYNGTQGPPGISPTGGDITLCNYQEKKSSEKTPSSYAAADVSVTEQSGKKIIGANCATNDAKVVLLSSTETGGTRTYQCDCTGTQNTGVSKMYCAVHFWEC
ncbi:uncharacterized protein [Montipora foliosa]|uniref:uncharacterized protein isoform X4 n=1 Tax=Montipora foliosa TaxID=591990 RepID=UPI0035F1A59C